MLQTVAWGPFHTLQKAKKVKKALERKYPMPSHLILPFQNIEVLKDVLEKKKNDSTS